VFDGGGLSEPQSIVIDGRVLGSDGEHAQPGDAGGVLLPGLIDAHVHVRDRNTLKTLGAWGVTTALDMATWPHGLVERLRKARGVTDIRSAGLPAIGPAGPHAHFPDMPPDAVVRDPEAGRRHVDQRMAERADYIKIVLEATGDGGPSPDTAHAVADAARFHGKRLVAHAATARAYSLALDIGADIITHVPLEPLADGDAERMAAGGRVAVPTLTMMRAMATLRDRPEAFGGALANVAALRQAGVPILAGTDAAALRGMPVLVGYGESLHDELQLLVEAGLSPADAIASATELPARYFGLPDRGAIRPGLRADLLLVDGDPLADIAATRAIRRVWCAGVPQADR
jgi:imidazolonepropionase-like amidohydrolase